MQIKILQLNMCGGTYFPAIKAFLEKNSFDIIFLQEVTRLKIDRITERPVPDCFQAVKQVLGRDFSGKLANDNFFTKYPTGALHSIFQHQGNALFFRNEFEIIDQRIAWLFHGPDPYPVGKNSYEDMSKNLLHLTLRIGGKLYDVISTHLAWAKIPIEQPYQRSQNRKFITYIKGLKHPFILAGDFNLKPDQPTILDLEKYGRNLIKEYGVKNTIEPEVHKAWEVIKPGFPVDYIFVSPDIKVVDFQALNTEHLSDHIGLTATIEL